jgi:hypothetical protein
MIVYINYTNNTNNYTIFKNRLGRTLLAPNTSTSLQTTLAAAAHPAEGQFLDEEQTLINAKSLIYRAGIIIIITTDCKTWIHDKHFNPRTLFPL